MTTMPEPAIAGPTPASKRAGMIISLGAIISLASVALNYIKASIDLTDIGGKALSESHPGFETNAGKIVLVLGIVLLIVGAMAYTKGKKIFAVLGIIVALLIVGASLLEITYSKKANQDDFRQKLAAQSGQSDQADSISQKLDVKVGPGPYVALAGGLLGLIGSIMAPKRKKDVAWTPPPAATGAPPPPAMTMPPAPPAAPYQAPSPVVSPTPPPATGETHTIGGTEYRDPPQPPPPVI
ncbi:MAG: hypothetical protein NVSMB57_06030 [Actinomycetota bacterium]